MTKYLPINGMPENEPRPLRELEMLNFGMSSTIASNMTLILISVIIPRRNFASLKYLI